MLMNSYKSSGHWEFAARYVNFMKTLRESLSVEVSIVHSGKHSGIVLALIEALIEAIVRRSGSLY